MPTSTELQRQLLPVELFHMIFDESASDWEASEATDDTMVRSHWTDFAHLIMKIASISVEWRAIALASPRLWRNVLCCEDSTVYFSPSVCLDRSGAVPLRVWIYGDVVVEDMHDTLTLHPTNPIARIHELTIAEYGIDGFDDGSGMWARNKSLMDFRCTVLRTLSISLSNKPTSVSDLVNILQAHAAIESLDICRDSIAIQWPEPRIAAVTLPSLCSLSIYETAFARAGYYLYLVDAPNIKRLTLAVGNIRPEDLDLDTEPGFFCYDDKPKPFHLAHTLSLGGFDRCTVLESIFSMVPNIIDIEFITMEEVTTPLPTTAPFASSELRRRLIASELLPLLRNMHFYHDLSPTSIAIAGAALALTPRHGVQMQPLHLYHSQTIDSAPLMSLLENDRRPSQVIPCVMTYRGRYLWGRTGIIPFPD